MSVPTAISLPDPRSGYRLSGINAFPGTSGYSRPLRQPEQLASCLLGNQAFSSSKRWPAENPSKMPAPAGDYEIDLSCVLFLCRSSDGSGKGGQATPSSSTNLDYQSLCLSRRPRQLNCHGETLAVLAGVAATFHHKGLHGVATPLTVGLEVTSEQEAPSLRLKLWQ